MADVRLPLYNIAGRRVAYTLIDARDAERLSEWIWHAGSGGYVIRQEKAGRQRKTRYLHREVLGLSPDDPLETDHINRDKLDNRRANLRAVNHSENALNTDLRADNMSGFKNVSFCRRTGRWLATFKHGGKTRYLGRFPTPEAAARAIEMARTSG